MVLAGRQGHKVESVDSITFAEPQAAPPVTTHEYVDLGLSVKWATCNVGAEKPEDYGDYFAWGETKPKTDYSWSTYKFTTYGGNSNTDSYTKRCRDLRGHGTAWFMSGCCQLTVYGLFLQHRPDGRSVCATPAEHVQVAAGEIESHAILVVIL